MQTLKRWLPALILMSLIFGFSSVPSREMPKFGLADFLVKKGGHALGYGLLALANLHGLNGKRASLAWLMTVVFAASDEIHQSFVAGRNASFMDVLLFDNFGALAGLWINSLRGKRKN